jgi:hypothetical protein
MTRLRNIVFASTACVTFACGSAPEQTQAQVQQGASAIVVPASSESREALGVDAWRIAMEDGKYSVGGFDENLELKFGMQTDVQDGASGEVRTEVNVISPEYHLQKRYSTKSGNTTFELDELSDNAEALHALELLQGDLSVKPSGSGLKTSALKPLDALVNDQKGSGNGFEAYDNPECHADSQCFKTVNQTNQDCHSSAFCSATKKEACGGSDAQCKADQAYVKNLGCDKKCAKKQCSAGNKLVCQAGSPLAQAKCPQSQCNAGQENLCHQMGAACANTDNSRAENPAHGGYGL